MRRPPFLTASLVVAVVVLALLQLEARRLRIQGERAVVARVPLDSLASFSLPAAGRYRLEREATDGRLVPRTITAMAAGDAAPGPSVTVTLESAKPVRRQGAVARQEIAVVTADDSGAVVLHLSAQPPMVGAHGERLVVLGGDLRAGGRKARLVPLLTLVLLLALGSGAVGAIRLLRERLGA